MKYVVDKEYFSNLYVAKFLIVGIIIAVALLCKLWGKTEIASLILGIPALITLIIALLTILVWVFLAIVMILFSK